MDDFRWSALPSPLWDDLEPPQVAMTLPEGERVLGLFTFNGTVCADTTCGVFRFVNGMFVLSNEAPTTSAA